MSVVARTLTVERSGRLEHEKLCSMSHALHLNRGVAPQAFADNLNRLASEGRNVETSHRTADEARKSYLEWIERVEAMLVWGSRDPAIRAIPLTERYWRVQQLDLATAHRPFPMIAAESRLVSEALSDLASELQRRSTQMSAGAAGLVVLDTNVLLHHNRPAKIAWSAVVDAEPPLRILLPLRVVEELDEHKWSAKAELRNRARAVLADLEEVLGSATRGHLQPGVTLEIAGGIYTASRSTDADADILDSCHEVEQFAQQPVTLVSGDKSMRIRARAEGIKTIAMPAKHRNRPD